MRRLKCIAFVLKQLEFAIFICKVKKNFKKFRVFKIFKKFRAGPSASPGRAGREGQRAGPLFNPYHFEVIRIDTVNTVMDLIR